MSHVQRQSFGSRKFWTRTDKIIVSWDPAPTDRKLIKSYLEILRCGQLGICSFYGSLTVGFGRSRGPGYEIVVLTISIDMDQRNSC